MGKAAAATRIAAAPGSGKRPPMSVKEPSAPKKRAKSAGEEGRTGAEVNESLGIVPSWDTYPKLKTLGFYSLVDKRVNLHSEIEFRKLKMKELDIEIQAAMLAVGTEKVTWEDRPVQIVTKSAADRISAEKLLKQGVEADVIGAATEPGKEYSYLLVGKPPKE